MANHTAPGAYPYGTNDPLPHDDANDLVAMIVKSPNFDEGSTHAPTADIALSGSMGGGLLFADLFKFRGVIDPTGGLYFTSPVSGFLRTSTLTAFDVFGPMTHAGASAVVQWTTGGSATWATGTTLSLASGATANLTGAVNIYSALVEVKSAGQIEWLNGSFLLGDTTATAAWSGTWAFGSTSSLQFISGTTATGVLASSIVLTQSGNVTISGATLTVNATSTLTMPNGSIANLGGTTTLTGSKRLILSPDRVWTRHATTIAAVTTNPADFADPAVVFLFDAAGSRPRIYFRESISDADAQCIVEFTPLPDETEVFTVSVFSRGAAGSDVDVLPTYRIVRWKDFDAVENMSALTTDDHSGTAGDWVTDHETVLNVTAHGTVDLEYRYGVLVTAAYDTGPLTMGFYFAAKAEGSSGLITGT